MSAEGGLCRFQVVWNGPQLRQGTFARDLLDSPPLSLPGTAQASEEIETENARFRLGSAEEFVPKQ